MIFLLPAIAATVILYVLGAGLTRRHLSPSLPAPCRCTIIHDMGCLRGRAVLRLRWAVACWPVYWTVVRPLAHVFRLGSGE